ncbi:ankyrin repeat-containing domain protein [Aspergillus germanicus]
MEHSQIIILPLEVLLLIARLLDPWDLINLAIAIPGIERQYKPKYWVPIRDGEGNSALHICAANQLDNIIVSLTEKRFDLHLTNRIGYTALHSACKAGHESSARLLLDAGLDPNIRAIGDTTALHLAVSRGDLSTIRLLIERGADISARTSGGYTALHWAVDSRNCQVAALLSFCGATVDQQDDFGRTPLHWAAWQGDESTVVILLEAGADPGRRDHNGYTPADLAGQAGFEEIVRRLKEMGSSGVVKFFTKFGITLRSMVG